MNNNNENTINTNTSESSISLTKPYHKDNAGSEDIDLYRGAGLSRSLSLTPTNQSHFVYKQPDSISVESWRIGNNE